MSRRAGLQCREGRPRGSWVLPSEVITLPPQAVRTQRGEHVSSSDTVLVPLAPWKLMSAALSAGPARAASVSHGRWTVLSVRVPVSPEWPSGSRANRRGLRTKPGEGVFTLEGPVGGTELLCLVEVNRPYGQCVFPVVHSVTHRADVYRCERARMELVCVHILVRSTGFQNQARPSTLLPSHVHFRF